MNLVVSKLRAKIDKTRSFRDQGLEQTGTVSIMSDVSEMMGLMKERSEDMSFF